MLKKVGFLPIIAALALFIGAMATLADEPSPQSDNPKDEPSVVNEGESDSPQAGEPEVQDEDFDAPEAGDFDAPDAGAAGADADVAAGASRPRPRVIRWQALDRMPPSS